MESPDDQKSAERLERVSESQFWFISIVIVIVLILMVVWRPWQTRPVNGVPNSVVATASP